MTADLIPGPWSPAKGRHRPIAPKVALALAGIQEAQMQFSYDLGIAMRRFIDATRVQLDELATARCGDQPPRKPPA